MRQVLDRNFKLGNTILPITLLLLQYCPSPQRYASDYQPPNYTLWYLEPHTRLSWLRSLLVILYKVGRGGHQHASAGHENNLLLCDISEAKRCIPHVQAAKLETS